MGNKWFMALVLAAVLAVGILVAFNSSQPYMYEPGFAGSYTYNLLFNSGLGMILGATGLGIVIGAIVGLLMGKPAKAAGRRGAGALFDDWGVSFCALAGLIYIVTRIMLGVTWSPRLVATQQSIAVTMNMNFVGMVIMLFGSLYAITRMLVSGDYSLLASLKDVFSFGKRGNYLPSHGWALWAVMVAFATVAIKGAFLVVVHLFGWPLSIIVVVSAIHDILILIALILAAVAIGFLVMENLPQAGKAVPKDKESRAVA